MTFPRVTAPDNSILRPIAFTSKSLFSAEKYYNIEREEICILHGLQKFHHYCLTREGQSIRTQAPGIHIQETYCKTDIEITMHPIKVTPIQNMHNLQTRSRPVHF